LLQRVRARLLAIGAQLLDHAISTTSMGDPSKCHPVWVKSRHQAANVQCPLLPQQGTFAQATGTYAFCRYCCKTRKMPCDQFPANRPNEPQASSRSRGDSASAIEHKNVRFRHVRSFAYKAYTELPAQTAEQLREPHSLYGDPRSPRRPRGAGFPGRTAALPLFDMASAASSVRLLISSF
jgi:hypothetical protein